LVVGPGLIVMEADNDAGAVSTYVQAGAQYGIHLLFGTILYQLFANTGTISYHRWKCYSSPFAMINPKITSTTLYHLESTTIGKLWSVTNFKHI
jgi:hypothetical protein